MADYFVPMAERVYGYAAVTERDATPPQFHGGSSSTGPYDRRQTFMAGAPVTAIVPRNLVSVALSL